MLTHERDRRLKILIIGVLQEWAETWGLETSGEMEANGAERVVNILDAEHELKEIKE